MGLKPRLLLLAAAVCALDLLSKVWIVRNLPRHAVETVIPGFLNLTHVRNSGVAFGLFSSLGDWGPWVLAAAGVVAIVVVAVYFRQTPVSEKLLLWALALILGGAIGNLIDRVVNKAVTDFIDAYVGSYHWHTFNVADSAITIGISLMLLDLLLQRRRVPEESPAS